MEMDRRTIVVMIGTVAFSAAAWAEDPKTPGT